MDRRTTALSESTVDDATLAWLEELATRSSTAPTSQPAHPCTEAKTDAPRPKPADLSTDFENSQLLAFQDSQV